MFGISPLGWIHTVGSLPAIPVAAYMFVRSGRIVPRSTAGTVYFASMLIGALTIFLIAHEPVSYIIAIATLVLLFIGYGASRISALGRAQRYIETISLTLTGFLLMVPTITETLTRVPDGHPFITDRKSPILIGVQGVVFACLLIGITAQIIHLRRRGRLTQAAA